ncbi:thiamine pyrophosphate-binding protein [Comamonas serinivorans]|uniref:Thiamine pyrophosphate-binding protein n=1 Tax=Comamonas serinivorans TaxID=1082851 RepID=A0A1Y0EL81_9BURK|nr:thiamine pyrophosphate-binding protein [Comamonas serinivorans]ARU04394.1 thiamine pyrophosphate-binding protein [Comamonas serinivorans]
MGNRHGGQLLVECLVAQGVTHAFGVPGESYLAVLDGFHAHREQIHFVVCRQEGGASFMAEAQGKLTGRPGVCFVTRGPGATNASIGIHTAFQDSTPLVVFIGDVAEGVRDREAFQEIDFNAMFGPSTKGLAKRVERIDQVERIPEYVARAFATAMSGRPGPVVLVLPEDMLTQHVNANVQALPRVQAPVYRPDEPTLKRARDLLAGARRPLVLAGGPGWTPEGAKALEHFAERWQLPVCNTFRFQDTFDCHHANYAGDVGLAINPKLAARIREADLLLVFGSRLGESTTSNYELIVPPRTAQTLIHVHPSAEEINRVYHADVGLCALLPAAAEAFAHFEPPAALPWAEWTRAAHADYLEVLQPQQLPGPVDMAAIVRTVNQLMPKDAVITNGGGNFASWAHRFYQYPGIARGGKVQLAPTNGAMGYGVPAGIAASILTGRPVFSITGDGDFMMNGQELATAMQYGGKPIILIVNNGMYGTIRMHQEREYPDHVAGTLLHNPDFVALAKAYGFEAARVEATADFEPAFKAALAAPVGTVIEVVLSPEVITTRGTLSAIRDAALAKQG